MTEFLPQHSNHLCEFCDSVSKYFGLNFVCVAYRSYLKRGVSSFSGRHMMALFWKWHGIQVTISSYLEARIVDTK